MGAKNVKGQNLDHIIQNQNGESRLHTGIIYNASNYVVEYYVEKAQFKEQSSKTKTLYSEQKQSLKEESQQQYSQEWDDWKDWQNSVTNKSKSSANKSEKSNIKKTPQPSQNNQREEQQEDNIRYSCVLVSIPCGKMEIKGLDSILLGKSYISICLRKQNQYLYFKKRERINHFSDLFLVVNNEGCEKMKKDLINQHIRQSLPDFSPIKRIDHDEASLSNRSNNTNRSLKNKHFQRQLF